MIIYRSIEESRYLGNAFITVGTFDGLHLGHQALIRSLVNRAREKEAPSVVVTFDPHPQIVLKPDGPAVTLLTTSDEKLALLDAAGVDYVLLLPFTRNLAQLSPEQFVMEILFQRIGFQGIILGFNHAFGKNAGGSEQLLQKLGCIHGFCVEQVAPVDTQGSIVSSTSIRNLLLDGQLEDANRMLNRCYHIAGDVVPGQQIGNTIGFPTANLAIDTENKLIPADGVYVALVDWQGKRYSGMVNIGFRPTVSGAQRSIEVHLFEFDQRIYGDRLDLHFVAYLRKEKKFNSLEALKQQLIEDKINSQQCLEDRSKEAFDGFNQRRKS